MQGSTSKQELDHVGPSASIVTVAVVQFLGSGAVLLGWGRVLWGLILFYRMYPRNHQVLASEIWIFFIALPIGFALLGVVTSIGLLFLREWARQLTILLSTVPVSVYALLFVLRPPSLFPPSPGPGGIFALGDIYLPIVGYLLVLLIPVSIWWLILFTRASVKAQFQVK